MANDKPNGEAGVSVHFERVYPSDVDPEMRGLLPVVVKTREELLELYSGPGLISGIAMRESIERKIQEIGVSTAWQRINDALALDELMNLPEPMDLSRFELAIGGRR